MGKRWNLKVAWDGNLTISFCSWRGGVVPGAPRGMDKSVNLSNIETSFNFSLGFFAFNRREANIEK
jgi:hypothetical protein